MREIILKKAKKINGFNKMALVLFVN